MPAFAILKSVFIFSPVLMSHLSNDYHPKSRETHMSYDRIVLFSFQNNESDSSNSMKKTKIFLGNAPWYKEGQYGVRAGSRWPHFRKEGENYYPFPFFLAYTAALLEKNEFEVSLIDGIASRMDEQTFIQKVADFSPHIVVLETSTPSFDADFQIAAQIKAAVNPEYLIFCGAHDVIHREEFLHCQDIINVVAVGEYEWTVNDIAHACEEKKDLDSIPGILFRKDGKVVKTPPRTLHRDIDTLPFPARHLLPMKMYYDGFCNMPYPSLQMWASRGCPYQCSFCSWPQLMYGSHQYRARDPQKVLDEVQLCLKTGLYRSVYFDDDTFNIDKKRVMAIAQGFIDRSFDVPWAFMARADLLDEEQLLLLKKSGLYAVKYGIESYNQHIVDRCGKALDLEKVRKVCLLTRELGIKMHLTFTFGLPGETWETAQRTLDFALEMDPDSVQFSIVTPFPGSRFFKEMEQKGFLLSKDWQNYNGYGKSVIKTEHLSAGDLEKIQKNANQTWEEHCSKRRKRKLTRDFFNMFINPVWGCRKIYRRFKQKREKHSK